MAGLTGVFGGTFDPPHLGHSILSDEARAELGLDQVLWVVTGQPPHKVDRAVTDIETRWAMAEAAVADEPAFQLSRADVDRPAPHYALGTLAWLRRRGHEHLAYIMGSDSLRDLPNWHEPQAFAEACDQIAVMRRPGSSVDLDDLERLIPGLTSKVRLLDAPYVGITGHDIRRRVKEDRAYRYLVRPGVAQYIKESGLYR